MDVRTKILKESDFARAKHRSQAGRHLPVSPGTLGLSGASGVLSREIKFVNVAKSLAQRLCIKSYLQQKKHLGKGQNVPAAENL